MSDAWACASSIRAAGRSIKGCFLVVCPVLRLCVKCHLICGRAPPNHLRDSHPQACTRLHTASPRPAPRQAPAFHPDGARLKPSRPLWGPRVKVSPPDNRWPCSPHSAPSHWGLGTPDPHTRLLGLSRHLRDCVPLPPPCPPAPSLSPVPSVSCFNSLLQNLVHMGLQPLRGCDCSVPGPLHDVFAGQCGPFALPHSGGPGTVMLIFRWSPRHLFLLGTTLRGAGEIET